MVRCFFCKGLFVLLLSVNVFVLFAQNFEKNGAIRYDFEFTGTANSVTIIHTQTKKLPHWGGSFNYLIDQTNNGSYRFLLIDFTPDRKTSDSVIYSRGFSPLFAEWQTTDEAAHKHRSFYHALFFPRPLTDVLVCIQKRDVNNTWLNVFSDTLRVNDQYIVDEAYPKYNADTLLYNGNTAGNIDLIFLSEGYTMDQMEKYINDSKRMLDTLFSKNPFSEYKHKFNVYALKVSSYEQGTDLPGENIYRNTAFQSSFYTFNSPRYLTISNLKPVYDALDAYAWDHFFVLVNSDIYGGGGCYNSQNICSVDNVASAFVFCHEFGHGFAGLADEYYNSSVEYIDYYNYSVEPYEPNITTLVDFENKWAYMVHDTVMVPTPRLAAYESVVGVFEGGGYSAKGIFSPAISCWMKESCAGAFCAVCQKAIEKTIILQTE